MVVVILNNCLVLIDFIVLFLCTEPTLLISVICWSVGATAYSSSYILFELSFSKSSCTCFFI